MFTIYLRKRGMNVSFPFGAAAVLAWITLPIGTRTDWPEYWTATGLFLALVPIILQRRPSRFAFMFGAIVFLIAAGLLRDSGGGIRSGAGVIALIPFFYVVLVSRVRADFVIMLVALAAFYAVPVLIIGGADYPPSQYRGALLTVAVSGVTGWVIQTLVDRVRTQAEQAHAHGRMLEQVGDAARELLDSPRVRDDVCVAARRICSASIAVLYEPTGSGAVITASSGPDVGFERIAAAPGSLVDRVIRSGVAHYVDSYVAHTVSHVDIWRAGGSPSAVLFQPLIHDGVSLGLLVLGWPEHVSADSTHRVVAALLANETAGVIARSDKLTSLVDEAHTDPLTGLPNRRAWDAALARAFDSEEDLAVAILDLDHFKEFNDSYGHPAGDRLLQECAAAWRLELRGGDLLTRLGGEEFGLLITGASESMALEVVERLRRRIPDGRTGSAGVAARRPGEPAEALIGRADAALYAAKSAGRDRALVSDAV